MSKTLFHAALLAASLGDTPSEPDIRITELLYTNRTTSGQPLVLPRGPISVMVTRVTVKPGTTLPSHLHPQPRYGYLLAGAITISNEATGKAQTFKAGDFIVEAIGQYHSATSVGHVAADLLVIDQGKEGVANTILKDGS